MKKLPQAIENIRYVRGAIADEFPALAKMLDEADDLIHDGVFELSNKEFIEWCKNVKCS